MKILIYITIAAAAVAACILFFVKGKKNDKNKTNDLLNHDFAEAIKKLAVKPDTVDLLKFESIISFFKSLTLQKGKDVPFLANLSLYEVEVGKKQLQGYISLAVGVYDEKTNEITSIRVINAKAIDEKTKSILGDDSLVVLN